MVSTAPEFTESGTATRATVGSSGTAGERPAPMVANALSLPVPRWGSAVDRLGKAMFTWPPSTSVRANALPLLGTCVMSTPPRCLNNSPVRWLDVPGPPDP